MSLRWFAISLLVVLMLPVTMVRAQGYGGGGYEERGDAVDCQSRNYAYTRCDVPWRDARLVRQLSDTRCIRGQNWGLDRHGLWVDRGCGGRFVAAGRYDRDRDDRYASGGWRPGPEWDQRFDLGCRSENYQYTFCAVDLGGGGRARLARQTSGTACIEGETWGWNRAGIWVNQGCAGVFTVDRRWR